MCNCRTVYIDTIPLHRMSLAFPGSDTGGLPQSCVHVGMNDEESTLQLHYRIFTNSLNLVGRDATGNSISRTADILTDKTKKRHYLPSRNLLCEEEKRTLPQIALTLGETGITFSLRSQRRHIVCGGSIHSNIETTQQGEFQSNREKMMLTIHAVHRSLNCEEH